MLICYTAGTKTVLNKMQDSSSIPSFLFLLVFSLSIFTSFESLNRTLLTKILSYFGKCVHSLSQYSAINELTLEL